MPTISQGVYTMGGVFADNLLEAFSGKVLGEEGFTKEDIMEVLFADMKKRKKSSGPKKPKALSGYTYYGQQNKDKINAEIKKLVDSGKDKPKYVSQVSESWKKLTKKQQEKWNEKAVQAFQQQQQEQQEQGEA